MKIRIEGPYYGHYSLARVNRGLALALANIDRCEVSISATEAEGFHRETLWEAEMTKMGVLYRDLRDNYIPDLVVRHSWPIESSGLKGRTNARLFPWEETRIPHEYIDQFNEYYDGILAPSQFVARVLRQGGVVVPVHVLPNAANLPRNLQPAEPHATGTIRFLHLSSCFPRKGVDTLLAAFCQRFAGETSASLTIKTFDNPHNDASQLLARWRERLGDALPAVDIITRDMSDHDLVRLIDDHHFVVLASRGEGFGLPVLEAHLRGRPVITPTTTALAELYIDGIDFPIASSIALAQTHVAELGSLWYEPGLSSLIEALGAAHDLAANAPHAYRGRIKNLAERPFHDWDAVGRRLHDIVRHITKPIDVMQKRRPRLVVVSSFQQICGVATYAESLLRHMDLAEYDKVIVLAPFLADGDTDQTEEMFDKVEIRRCWNYWGDFSQEVKAAYTPADGDNVIIQHHSGFFAPRCLDEFLGLLAPMAIRACVALHSVLDNCFPESEGSYRDLSEQWSNRFSIMVHSLRERQALANDDVILFPHPFEAHAGYSSLRPSDRSGIIASFGFMRPHKGYRDLIEAWPLVLQQVPGAKLLLLASLHPAVDSRLELARCQALIAKLGLTGSAKIHPEFLDLASIQAALSYVDGVVFPYHDNCEGASGAVHIAASAHAAIAVSDIALFSEFGSSVKRLTTGRQGLADVMVELLIDADERQRLRNCSAELVRKNSFYSGARWIQNLLRLDYISNLDEKISAGRLFD